MMQERYCAICGQGNPFTVLYPERLSQEPLSFAARKTPDHQHFCIVRCASCGLIYSKPTLSPEEILDLYRQGEFIDEPQRENMLADYLEEFKKIVPLAPTGRLLEIGCADGFFLKRALNLGFQEVVGIEPSVAAVGQASPEVKKQIIQSEFKPGLFGDNFFDVVCFFQVFDHVVDPNSFLQSVYRYLRPGGMLFAIHHNIRALMPTILREKSSTYDISHLYLWDHQTMNKVLAKNGFVKIKIWDIANRYQADHVLRMLPLPVSVKQLLRSVCQRLGWSNLNIKMKVENMAVLAFKENC